MNAPARIALVVAAAVVAVVLFLVLREDGEEAGTRGVAATAAAETTDTDETGDAATTTEAAPDVVRARIEVGPDGPSGVRRIDARQGQRVELTVTSALADHIHVHGYDLLADVAPGTPARFRFQATLPGRFEIELEDRGQPLAQLRVAP